jgi:dethiobiotin synthetase
MAKKLFISATNTNIGKTYASLRILKTLGKKGVLIGAIKPIETGVLSNPTDAQALLDICQKYNPNFKALKPFDICAYTFTLPAAPFCADKQKQINITHILKKIKEIEQICDFLLIEGAGGLLVPITKEFFMIDLIEQVAPTKTLLVTPSYLGCINETLLSVEVLRQRAINFDWCVNLYKDKESFDETTKPFYDSYFQSWQTLDEYIVTL